MCNVAISTVLLYCSITDYCYIVTLVRLSLVTNKGYLLTYLLTFTALQSTVAASAVSVSRTRSADVVVLELWRAGLGSALVFFLRIHGHVCMQSHHDAYVSSKNEFRC